MKLVLASNSPRRKELLSGLGVDFEVKVAKGVDEGYPRTLDAADVAEYIAVEKASAYAVADDEVVLTADTVVVVDNNILGKPKDEADALRMLHAISGKTHKVVTGVCIKNCSTQRSFSVSTDVTFKKLANHEIEHYVKTFKPYDKAGAYGIQEWIGYIGVTSISGSYYNVMGLPVQRVYQELVAHFGLEI